MDTGTSPSQPRNNAPVASNGKFGYSSARNMKKWLAPRVKKFNMYWQE
jgi:hypothetical protein